MDGEQIPTKPEDSLKSREHFLHKLEVRGIIMRGALQAQEFCFGAFMLSLDKLKTLKLDRLERKADKSCPKLIMEVLPITCKI